MKRATDRVARHLAPMSEVRTEVRAECVQQGNLAALRPKEHEIASEILERQHGPGVELVGVGDLKPTVGNRKRKAIVHRRAIVAS